MKSFQKLPPQLQCAEVKEYYDILCKKQGSLILKRVLDIFASVILLVFLIIPIAVIAVIIKIDSKGSVFYKQQRVTTYGKKFKILKFRTMITGADKLGSLVTTDCDSRVTDIGRFLRKYRLDELPQIFNILKGEMSFVGPRPERQEIAEKYEEIVPEFRFRLKVKAGLTGYAQVYGKYNTTPYDKLKLDLTYIQTYSAWLDVKLMLMTFKIMFQKENTEGVDEKQTTAIKKES